MTQAIYLVTRAAGDEGLPMVDGVHSVVVSLVNTSNDATVIAAAVAACNASKGAIIGAGPFDATYFDTVTDITALADLTGYIFGGVGTEAGAAAFDDS